MILQAVAALLGVHLRTIRRWIDAGDLAAVLIGTVVRIRSADLDAFILVHLQPAPRPTSSGARGKPNKSCKSKGQ